VSTPPDVTVSGGDYEHTLGITGLYQHLRLRYEPMRVQDIFVPMLESRRFEACEFSLANYITLRGTGQHWLTAVPVFPNRAFRHGMAVTRKGSPLESLAQLAGKRIGVEDYSMTAAVWFRGILQDEHGVDLRSIRWVTRSKQRFALPAGANVDTTDADLEDMLGGEALDALLGFTLRDNLLPPPERRLRTVLADPRSEEEAYYRRTSIYPIMHCVVIRNDVLEKNPALGAAIFEACAAAKERAYRRQLGATLVPWGKNHWARAFELFGGDPLPYGLTPANRFAIERLAQYLEQQGFVRGIPPTEVLFPLTVAG
jgi:4,5-dihydroxyphthalate decarboxylase